MPQFNVQELIPDVFIGERVDCIKIDIGRRRVQILELQVSQLRLSPAISTE